MNGGSLPQGAPVRLRPPAVLERRAQTQGPEALDRPVERPGVVEPQHGEPEQIGPDRGAVGLERRPRVFEDRGKVLERAGHTVSVVENGADAVAALIGGSFDVALMDLNMPVLNGIDAFKQYRSSLGGRVATPVIALTADATTEASARCAEAGFQACATKPIEPQRLLELVSQVAPRSGNESESPALAPEPDHEVPDHSAASCKSTVRRETLRKLEQLGGRPFVEELIKQFTTDTEDMLRGLKLAIAKSDASEFDDHLHAMRSAAGNIGAESLYYVCLSLKQITQEELAVKGNEHLHRLAAEFAQVQNELADYLVESPVKKDRVSDFA